MIEHIINDKKIHIHDNVLSDKLVKKWIDFYENDVSFTLSANEQPVVGSPFFFSMPLKLKDTLEVFEIDSWLQPYIAQFDPNFSLAHFHRSYLNAVTKGDRFDGHVDSTGPYLVCLLFMNPYVENEDDSGFYIEDLYITNKFNRMIVFDGRLFHKSQVPSDDFVRLTLYFGFSSKKIRFSMQEAATRNQNRWFKSIKRL